VRPYNGSTRLGGGNGEVAGKRPPLFTCTMALPPENDTTLNVTDLAGLT
jgi:hypothetical protein